MTEFENGFEEGDFSAYTGTSGTPTVQDVTVHHGTYAMYVDAFEWCYKDLPSTYATCYARVYVRFGALINETYYYSPFLYLGDKDNWAYATGVELYCTDGSNHVFRLTDGASGTDEGTTVVAVDTWYCIELLRKTGSGSSVMYVNGVQEASLAFGYYDTDRVQVGGNFSLDSTGYLDCVVVDTSRINCESAGGLTIPITYHYFTHIHKKIRGG